ncbi:hypothetical protein Bbelb_106040 [Branchiostoma belcheri]|nr:hypothetical protein Bbelb_106040 [Branchiostoma belcheri]
MNMRLSALVGPKADRGMNMSLSALVGPKAGRPGDEHESVSTGRAKVSPTGGGPIAPAGYVKPLNDGVRGELDLPMLLDISSDESLVRHDSVSETVPRLDVEVSIVRESSAAASSAQTRAWQQEEGAPVTDAGYPCAAGWSKTYPSGTIRPCHEGKKLRAPPHDVMTDTLWYRSISSVTAGDNRAVPLDPSTGVTDARGPALDHLSCANAPQESPSWR